MTVLGKALDLVSRLHLCFCGEEMVILEKLTKMIRTKQEFL